MYTPLPQVCLGDGSMYHSLGECRDREEASERAAGAAIAGLQQDVGGRERGRGRNRGRGGWTPGRHQGHRQEAQLQEDGMPPPGWSVRGQRYQQDYGHHQGQGYGGYHQGYGGYGNQGSSYDYNGRDTYQERRQYEGSFDFRQSGQGGPGGGGSSLPFVPLQVSRKANTPSKPRDKKNEARAERREDVRETDVGGGAGRGRSREKSETPQREGGRGKRKPRIAANFNITS